MKKLILLLAAVTCLLSTQAQTITKITAKANTYPYTDLVDGIVFEYTSPTFASIAFFIKYTFQNGSVALDAGDTIVVKGTFGNNSYFPEVEGAEKNSKFEYAHFHRLTSNLPANGTVEIAIPISEPMNGHLNAPVQVNDTTYSLRICGEVIHISNPNYVVNAVSTRKCNTVMLLKRAQTTSIAEVNGMSKIRLYPNPVNSDLTITNLKGINVEIYNIVGQQIIYHENASGDLSVDMSNLPDGVYFVKLKDGKIVRTEKIKLVK